MAAGLPRLLVVEDDHEFGPKLVACGERCGFTCTLVPDGNRALAALASGPAHNVVLLDLLLGDGPDGWRIYESLRRDARHDATKILVISQIGHLNTPELRGIVGQIQKPGDDPALAEAFWKYLQRHLELLAFDLQA